MSIAVIIACHNAEPYLAQTIGSVLDQDHAASEIIVVDDSSTDGSLALARRFEAACGGRVQVYTERFGHAGRARNLGASLARSDALMFLDADDVLAPDALGALHDALSAQPHDVAACPWRRLEFADGQWTSWPASCARRRPDQDALSAWLTNWYYPPCSVLWSRAAFVGVGGWDEDAVINQDGDLMMRALVNGVRLIETEKGTSYYRRLPEGQLSLSGTRFTFGGLAGQIAVIEKIARLLEEAGKIDSYREAVSQAFRFIAADAAGRFEGLRQHASALERTYASSGLTWLAGGVRSRRGAGGTKTAAAPPRDQVEEIDFGIVRAEAVLAAVPATATPGAPPATVHVPAVSVVIPTYNRAHLLRRTLESVLQQTLTDFEVLVVDDCSSDDPGEVVADCNDPRLRYLRQAENSGVAAARNRGLREARAPLVAFLDDDDEWFPRKLELQAALFRHAPDVGLVYSGVETVTADGSRSVKIPTARGDLYRELLARNLLHGGSSAVIRRNVITEVGFFDETLPAIEDYDYWIRIARCFKVDCVSEPLVRYHDPRDHSEMAESRRSTNIKANLDARAQLYRKHGEQMRKEGVAHLFLVCSALRHRIPPWNDFRAARRLALEAFRLAPASAEVRTALRNAFVTGKLRTALGKSGRGAKKLLKQSLRKTSAGGQGTSI